MNGLRKRWSEKVDSNCYMELIWFFLLFLWTLNQNHTLYITYVYLYQGVRIMAKLFFCTFKVMFFVVYSENKAVGVMKPGHTFTIEPMISQGTDGFTGYWWVMMLLLYNLNNIHEHFHLGTWRDEIWPDNWTAVTQVSNISKAYLMRVSVIVRFIEARICITKQRLK